MNDAVGTWLDFLRGYAERAPWLIVGAVRWVVSSEPR